MRWLLAAVALGAISAGTASADVMWYNGDFNGNDGTYAANHGGGFLDIDQWVYDNFKLPSNTTLNSVFGYFLFAGGTPVGAEFEIRSGVSANDGGTLVQSGSCASFGWTPTATTFSSPIFGDLTLYRLDLAVSFTLTAGNYWLGLRPIGDTGTETDTFLAQTNGDNAVGSPPGNDGNSYVDSLFFGASFDPADPVANVDYSLGITEASATTPEPASGGLLAIMLLAMAFHLRWRARKQSKPERRER